MDVSGVFLWPENCQFWKAWIRLEAERDQS